MVTVKESLGKHNAIPSIDFDTADAPRSTIFDPSKSPADAQSEHLPQFTILFNHRTDQGAEWQSATRWEELYGDLKGGQGVAVSRTARHLSFPR
jgi:DNA mismatch repair protein MutL